MSEFPLQHVLKKNKTFNLIFQKKGTRNKEKGREKDGKIRIRRRMG